MNAFRLFTLGLLVTTTASAHPPKEVKASYDKADKTLSIVVTHSVSDVKTHYIDVIKVQVDGKEVAKNEYKEQSTPESHQAKISIGDVKPGSQINVKASCSRFGSKSFKFSVD